MDPISWLRSVPVALQPVHLVLLNVPVRHVFNKPLLTLSVPRYAVQKSCGPASPLACGAGCAPALPRAAAPHRRGRGLPAGAARGRAARAGRSGARSAAGARATEPGHRHPSGMFLQYSLHITCWKSRTWRTKTAFTESAKQSQHTTAKGSEVLTGVILCWSPPRCRGFSKHILELCWCSLRLVLTWAHPGAITLVRRRSPSFQQRQRRCWCQTFGACSAQQRACVFAARHGVRWPECLHTGSSPLR